MWVNITLKTDDVNNILAKLEYLYETLKKPLLLTFNTTTEWEKIKSLLENIIEECKKRQIPIVMGPQFLGDYFIVDGEIQYVDELYFASPAEIILWYLKKHELPNDITSIALVGEDLGISPIIIDYKTSEEDIKKYEIYFLYESNSIEDINKLVRRGNYHFINKKE